MTTAVPKRCPCFLGAPMASENAKYCTYCGRKMGTVVWECTPEPAYVGTAEIRVAVRFNNIGAVPVQVQALEWLSPIPPPEEQSARVFEPIQLAPGEHMESPLQVTIQVPATSRNASTLTLGVRTQPRIEVEPEQLTLAHPPKIETDRAEFSVTFDSNAPEATATLSVSVRANGGSIVLRDEESILLRIGDGGAVQRPMLRAGDVTTTRLGNAFEPLSVTIGAGDFDDDHDWFDARVEVYPAFLHQPLLSPTMRIHRVRPLRLQLELEELGSGLVLNESDELHLLKGRAVTYKLLLRNKSGGVLKLDSIEPNLPRTLAELGLTAKFQPVVPFPLRLQESARAAALVGELSLDARRWTGGSLESTVRLLFKAPGQPPHERLLHVRLVEPAHEPDRTLAIDFGNTNSVAAATDDLQMPTVLALPALATRAARERTKNVPNTLAIVPTAVLYQPAGENGDTFNVDAIEVSRIAGSAADAIGAGLTHDIFNYVSSFKPRLGLDQHLHFPHMPNVRITPERVAQDYLQRVVEEIERVHGRRYSRVVLTHPVRFWTNQRNALRETIEMALDRPLDVEFLDEATAAALSYAFDLERAERSGNGRAAIDESVLVFDFGGGTIDLTVCRIHNASGERTWHVEHLLSDGTSEFGGDAVTQLIAGVFHTHLSKGPKVPFRNFLKTRSWRFESEEQRALENGIRLFQSAESYKIERLGTKTQTAGDIHSLNVSLALDSGEMKKLNIEFEKVEAEVEKAIVESLQGSMNLVRELLQRLPARRASNNGQPILSRVLMTGQSSRLEIVHTLLEKTVHEAIGANIPVKRVANDDLKEIVAKGAALYGTLNQGLRENVILKRSSRVHVFLRDNNEIGSDAFIKVIDQFQEIRGGCTVICSSEPDETGPHFPLIFGMQIDLIEAFVDLSNPLEFGRAREGSDFRRLAVFPLNPPGLSSEDIENARLEIHLSESEEVSVGLLLAQAKGSEGEEHTVPLWPPQRARRGGILSAEIA